MKYKILFLSIFISLVFSCDKENFSVTQADSFIKYYGGEKPYKGVQVLAIENGGYLVLGNFENSNRGQDICLIKTDMYGNTTGPVMVYGSNYNDLAYVIKKNEAGYIIAGSTTESNSDDKDVFLVQINNSGDTLWTKSYDFGGNLDDEAYDILVLDNQDLIITGYSEVSVSNLDLLIAKVNSYGSLLWDYSYGYSDNELGHTVIEAGDYFIVGGTTNSRPIEFNSTYNAYILQLTKTGTNPLPLFFGTEGDSEIKTLVNAGNNTYYAAGTVEFSQPDESKIRIVKFKHDDRDRLNILWTEEYGEQIFNQASYLKVNNGSLTVVGTSGMNIDAGDLLLLNLDTAGVSPQYFYTGDGVSFSGTGFDYASDGGYIISGSNFSATNSVITLAKVNVEGKL